MSDRLERLINLVIALREARVPMTAEEIREKVAGYGQTDPSAFRRMFERDKADLRDLGVPLVTAPVDRWRDVEGYRIRPEDYDLPPIALEPAELAALAVAAQVTGLDGGRALRKLEVDAPEGGRPGTLPALAVSVDAPHRDALLAAQLEGRRVRFPYRPPGRPSAVRTLDPAGLVHRAGRWYVVGTDVDRMARRAFRLDRIEGDVVDVGVAADRSQGLEGPVGVTDVVPGTGESLEARVAASPTVSWLVARRARGHGTPTDDGRTSYTVSARDADDLLSWFLPLGPEAELLGPPGIRAQVAAALDRLEAAHR